MEDLGSRLRGICQRIQQAQATRAQASHAPGVRLLAVSKTRTVEEVRALASYGQLAFGENYVQESTAKQQSVGDLALEWHLIGHLQSNKARAAAEAFDWVQSIDRASLIDALARHRPAHRQALNALIQVNIDDEGSKSGCLPGEVASLANRIAGEPRLILRGLMAIPAPASDPQVRRAAFRSLRSLFDELRHQYAQVDTLSMGMSADFELAIAEGATLVRVGTALFGARPGKVSG